MVIKILKIFNILFYARKYLQTQFNILKKIPFNDRSQEY